MSLLVIILILVSVVLVAEGRPFVKYPEQERGGQVGGSNTEPDNHIKHLHEFEEKSLYSRLLHEDRDTNKVVVRHSEVNKGLPLAHHTESSQSNVRSKRRTWGWSLKPQSAVTFYPQVLWSSPTTFRSAHQAVRNEELDNTHNWSLKVSLFFPWFLYNIHRSRLEIGLYDNPLQTLIWTFSLVPEHKRLLWNNNTFIQLLYAEEWQILSLLRRGEVDLFFIRRIPLT